VADSYLTSTDVVTLNRVDLDIVIRSVMEATPFLNSAAARTTESDNFKYPRITALPSVGYRAVNDGVENVKSSYEQVSVDLKYIDASFNVDIAAAKVDERGVDHIMSLEAFNHLRAAMKVIEGNIFKATTGGFDSLPELTTLATLGDHCISNGGAAATAQTSVYAISMGPGDYEVLWGEGGVINISPRMMVQRAGSSAGEFWAYAHEVSGYVAHKLGADYSVHRLANVDATATLDDTGLAGLLASFPVGFEPDVLVMNRRAVQQLRDSRTATNPTGQPAPFPESAHGKPIIVVDSIPDNEAVVA
jgi:hypothetical protein